MQADLVAGVGVSSMRGYVIYTERSSMRPFGLASAVSGNDTYARNVINARRAHYEKKVTYGKFQ
jgi:hypothetical protein